MWSVLEDILLILNESAIYLLFGFLLAGVLHVALGRMEWLTTMLSRKTWKATALAALIGVPMPLCSCSVLPAALTLRRRGASKGATVSFLISVPETDVVSILLTYGLLGPVMAIFRPLAAVITAMVTGLATNLVDRAQAAQEGESSGEGDAPCCHCSSEKAGEAASSEDAAQPGVLRRILQYGFVDFFDGIIGMLLFGVVLGGLITTFLPDIGIERFAGGSWPTMLAMLIIGIPMYVCATASTPIAAGLIVAGLSPGAALVFLLAGPATNIGSLLILRRELGKTVVLVYLLSIAVVSLAMGFALDAAFGMAALRLPAVMPMAHEMSPGFVKILGSGLLLILALNSARRIGVVKLWADRIRSWTGIPLTARRVKIGTVILAILVWFGTGFFTVGAGERAMVTRFGRVTARNLGPGLHTCWPYPIGVADIASIDRVQWIELGFRRMPEGSSPEDQLSNEELSGESWMLTGNEDIIDIRWVVQYRVKDSDDGGELEKYLYGVDDPQSLVRSVSESAIRSAVAGRNIDTLLTTDRGPVEACVQHDYLQPWLDRCNAGVEVVRVNLIDVHAPQDVHWSFRDVASAAEDKMRMINLAHEYADRVVLEARGEADKTKLDAEGEAYRLVESARGLGRAFVARLEAYRAAPSITELRLYLEAMDACLPGLKKIVVLSEAIREGTDLWLMSERARGALPGFPVETGGSRR